MDAALTEVIRAALHGEEIYTDNNLFLLHAGVVLTVIDIAGGQNKVKIHSVPAILLLTKLF